MQTETKFVFNTDYLGANSLNYLAAWELQKQLHARVVQGADPQILLLEHPAVYTCGRRTEPHERPLNPKGAEVIEVDRGGKITFHGPGQLVGYPIIKLPAQIGVVDYVRRLEEALIAVCKELGLAAIQVPCRSGVWLPATPTKPERKLAAIGIRVSRGVTMHGFALNCNVDLERFNSFVPCGISDAGVSSLSAELGTEITTQAVLEILCQQLTKVLDFESSMITKDLS